MIQSTQSGLAMFQVRHWYKEVKYCEFCFSPYTELYMLGWWGVGKALREDGGPVA